VDRPQANRRYTAQGTARCELDASGVYRTVATGSGVYDGRPSGSFQPQYSSAVDIKCRATVSVCAGMTW
jgi:hypothetical protein